MTFKIELVNVNLHDFDVRESDLYSYDFFEPYCLQLIDDHIELKNLSKPKSGGVFVDFVNGKLAWRRLHGGGNGQPIAKAVFSKKKEKPGGTLPRSFLYSLLPMTELIWLIIGRFFMNQYT